MSDAEKGIITLKKLDISSEDDYDIFKISERKGV